MVTDYIIAKELFLKYQFAVQNIRMMLWFLLKKYKNHVIIVPIQKNGGNLYESTTGMVYERAENE